MFNPDFYPTPQETIDLMLAPLSETYDYQWSGNQRYKREEPIKYLKNRFKILEPSAGKGDILDYLVSDYSVKKEEICCIEIEPELRSILNDKGYKVIESDFLKYSEPYLFSLIVMNPPFSKGVSHLIKAWEVLNGGDVVCLLNAETIRNPYTAERQFLLKLIEEHGRFEFVGNVFKDAERTTNVECVIVWLHKNDEEGIKFSDRDFDHDEKAENSEYAESPLASASMIEALVDQYNQASRLLVEIDSAKAKYDFYVSDVLRHFDKRQKGDLNKAIDELKLGFWQYVFDKTGVGRATTSNFVKDFQKFMQNTSNLAFTVDNIMAVLEHFVLNSNSIMQDCINSVFDTATAYHEKNSVHPKGEGWKTNKSWKIASKVIIPRGLHYDTKWHTFAIDRYGEGAFYKDIDKILCFLSGKKIDKIVDLHTTIDKRCDMLNGHDEYKGKRERYDKEFETEFFRVRFFKKGTVHLIFKDVELLGVFNRAAAEGKNWVGAGY